MPSWNASDHPCLLITTPIRRGRFTVAVVLAVCAAVVLWLSFKDSWTARERKHDFFTSRPHALPGNSTLSETCPVQPVCTPETPPDCPEPFLPERMSEQLFPPSAKVDGHESKSPWIAENNKALRELLECLENRNCLENQSKCECI